MYMVKKKESYAFLGYTYEIVMFSSSMEQAIQFVKQDDRTVKIPEKMSNIFMTLRGINTEYSISLVNENRTVSILLR